MGISMMPLMTSLMVVMKGVLVVGCTQCLADYLLLLLVAIVAMLDCSCCELMHLQ